MSSIACLNFAGQQIRWQLSVCLDFVHFVKTQTLNRNNFRLLLRFLNQWFWLRFFNFKLRFLRLRSRRSITAAKNFSLSQSFY